MAGQARNDSYLFHHADGDAVGDGEFIAGVDDAALGGVVVEPGAPVVVIQARVRGAAPV